MAENSKISWTDHTANFWWGCFKVSEGCANCYASTLANRYGKQIWGPPSTTDREYKKGIWKELPKWDKQAGQDGVRRRVFVSSMADFFEDHPQVVELRCDALHLISQCRNLDFQVLTKRPENINRMIEQSTGRHADTWLSDNDHVWLGTSVENQEQAEKRIPHLLRVPAAVRFLSCEPLLGPVSLRALHGPTKATHYCDRYNVLTGDITSLYPERAHLAQWGTASKIHWVVTGAESGHGARPMDLDWVRSLRDQCQAAGVPFFLKQIVVNGKKIELPMLDGRVWSEMPNTLQGVLE